MIVHSHEKVFISGTRIALNSNAGISFMCLAEVVKNDGGVVVLRDTGKEYSPGYVRPLECGVITTDFWLYRVTDGVVHLRQVLGVMWDDGDSDMWYGSWAHQSFQILSQPSDVDEVYAGQLRRRDKLLKAIEDGHVTVDNFKKFNSKNYESDRRFYQSSGNGENGLPPNGSHVWSPIEFDDYHW